jgi:hypothetical protein
MIKNNKTMSSWRKNEDSADIQSFSERTKLMN